mmetsp:Transcript_23326/g.78989  ORF Transcript_23326/g.78989 Transcript_23326/m.78989 type:complete len:200 (+) Transcript_23326:1297-1896(+)
MGRGLLCEAGADIWHRLDRRRPPTQAELPLQRWTSRAHGHHRHRGRRGYHVREHARPLRHRRPVRLRRPDLVQGRDHGRHALAHERDTEHDMHHQARPWAVQQGRLRRPLALRGRPSPRPARARAAPGLHVLRAPGAADLRVPAGAGDRAAAGGVCATASGLRVSAGTCIRFWIHWVRCSGVRRQRWICCRCHLRSGLP